MDKNAVLDRLESLSYLLSEQSLDFESVDSETSIIRGELVFVNGFRLDFREFESPDIHDYRFQLMDEDDDLVRRWDTARHHEELENFPFHVHKPEEVESSEELTSTEILEKTEEIVLDKIQ
jgi:hypothetical protein